MNRRIAIILDTRADLASPLLDTLLSHAGIDRAACFIGVMDFPEGFKNDLGAWHPHFILCLGPSALRAFRGSPGSLDDWRGSLFLAAAIAPGVKCLATYGPSRIRKEWGLQGIVRFDLRRAAQEAQTDGLVLEGDTIYVDLAPAEIIDRLHTILRNRTIIAVDIEGGCDFVSCIGFATSSHQGFVIPFIHADGTSWWDEATEIALWQTIAPVLEDSAVPKVLQFSGYDNFALVWSYGILIAGIVDDTMLKHFELYPEMPKSLAFQTSFYTCHPFYKHERNSPDDRTRLIYCGKDCCRTFECNVAMGSRLMPGQRAHYQTLLQALTPTLYASLRGAPYDYEKAKQLQEEVQQVLYAKQDEINLAAITAKPEDQPELARVYAVASETDFVPILAAAFCSAGNRSEPPKIKVLEDVVRFAKPSRRHDSERAVKLVRAINSGYSKNAVRGELSILLGLHINSSDSSAKGDAKWFLYTACGFPPQRKKEGNRLTDRLSSDDAAVLKCWCKTGDRRALAFLELRALQAKLKALKAEPDRDGRVRFAYNLVATPSCELAAYESPVGGKVSPKTLDLRLIKADEGCEIERYWLDPGEPLCIEIFVCRYHYMGPGQLSDRILEESRKFGELVYKSPAECKKLLADFFAANPSYRILHESTSRKLRTDGYLTSSAGFRRQFFGRKDDKATLREALAHLPAVDAAHAKLKALLAQWNDPANRRPDGSLILEPLLLTEDTLISQRIEKEGA